MDILMIVNKVDNNGLYVDSVLSTEVFLEDLGEVSQPSFLEVTAPLFILSFFLTHLLHFQM